MTGQAAEVRIAGTAVRAAAVIVDGIITFVGFGVVFALLFGKTQHHGGSASFSLSGAPALLLFVASFAYWIVGEHVFGATIGKRIFSLRVVGADGVNPGWGASIGRNLLRVVDSFPYILPYLVGFIVAKTNGDRQRIGDKAAGTRVVHR